jgi:exoribonuclease R
MRGALQLRSCNWLTVGKRKGSVGVQIRGQVQESFPEYVDSLCSGIVAAVHSGEAADDGLPRTDFVDLPAIAIDDITTLDVDDAVSVEARAGGGWRVAVHVADPAAYIKAGDPLDVEAWTRYAAACLPACITAHMHHSTTFMEARQPACITACLHACMHVV